MVNWLKKKIMWQLFLSCIINEIWISDLIYTDIDTNFIL